MRHAVQGSYRVGGCLKPWHCLPASHPPPQAYRVLKPGGTLVFVQRLRGGPLQTLLGGSAGAVGALRGAPALSCLCVHLCVAILPTALPRSLPLAADPTLIDTVQDYSGWDFVQVDAALQGSDLHAVGVAVKPLAAKGSGAEGSVDATAFEALMRRGKGKQQQQQQAGGFQQKK